MEIDAIRQLIETDEQTRKKIEELSAERNQLKQDVEAEKKKLHEDAWNNVHQRVEETRKQLDEQIQKDEAENAAYLAEASASLNKMYEENKDRWCKELTDRILGKESS